MEKKLTFILCAGLLFGGVFILKAQKSVGEKINKVLYFNPEVEPDLEEIKEPTNTAFFSAVSDNLSERKNKMLKTETQISFDSIDQKTIADYCMNNDADFAVVPKVKYFKVGFGKYVFSNQVVVSMKLFDAQGNLLTETDYDTYKKNMRLLGSTTNSVKIGTNGAIKGILKQFRKNRHSDGTGF
ncbi:pyruvate decarboxylase [uncultured Chryseobacterium sp.]|uniref:pyruvate decarboxylase n=1 Tax=uncultured Chryseobacterium sp. TaxID=259322 RepID=UPI0025CD9A0E|nr:pyruvate decarboxylase [uncultured Chryseobacterium sp.]